MNLILKIAWRNILRHKGKSLIIGMILLFGSLIMTVGNGVLSGMDRGIQENIVNRFMGDIVIVSTNQKENSVMFGTMGKQVQVISGYTNIRAVLQKQDYISNFLPLAIGASLVLNEEGDPNFTLLLGVSFDDYQAFFISNVEPVEGRLMTNGERGILISVNYRKRMYDMQGFWVSPQDYPLEVTNLIPDALSNLSNSTLSVKTNLVFMGFSDNSSVDIRTPVRGVFRFHSLNNLWEGISIIDIESFRECFNYSTAADADVKLTKEKETLLKLDNENLDDMFSEDSMIESQDLSTVSYDARSLQKATERKEGSFDIDTGSYNLVFVKLKKGENMQKSLDRLNSALSNAQVDARAMTWKQAAGTVADMATIVRGALYGFVIFIFFVAIIVIMNTLSMAAMERVTEIGMMRAVGAKKGFISWMFAGETAMLSVLFGGAGIVLGALIIQVMAMMKIATDNEILQLLFGGEYFNPMLGAGDIIVSIILLSIVTLIAMAYPVYLARRIQPLEAIARD